MVIVLFVVLVVLHCLCFITTVETVLKDHPIGHKNMGSEDRWSLVTGSFTLKCRTFCQKLIVFQDRWFLMAVVSQDRLHCSVLLVVLYYMWWQ